MTDKLSVTVVVPVRNEAKRIGECLQTVVNEAHEVLVVDSGSNDGTSELARAKGAAVLQFAWVGGTERKRNWVLRTYPFATEWVLFLDADERMCSAAWAAVAEAMSSGAQGLEFRYINHFAGTCLRWGDPQRKVAMVRIGRGRYETLPDLGRSSLDMEVHEHLVVDGSVVRIPTPLLHLDDRGVDHWFRKHLEYAEWEARRVESGGTLSRALRQTVKYRGMKSLWFPFAYFVYSYILRMGFLDGRAGLLYGLAKLSYFLQVAVRVRVGGQKLGARSPMRE
ncbi:MAG: glycosyltransferase family 2 protein [Thermoanaerobaculia bacterium]